MISFTQNKNHRNDILLHRGYAYQGNVLQKSISAAMYLESKRAGILAQLETPISTIIDNIKMIKKWMNWTLPWYFTNFN